jgi:hypothetical protein
MYGHFWAAQGRSVRDRCARWGDRQGGSPRAECADLEAPQRYAKSPVSYRPECRSFCLSNCTRSVESVQTFLSWYRRRVRGLRRGANMNKRRLTVTDNADDLELGLMAGLRGGVVATRTSSLGHQGWTRSADRASVCRLSLRDRLALRRLARCRTKPLFLDPLPRPSFEQKGRGSWRLCHLVCL